MTTRLNPGDLISLDPQYGPENGPGFMVLGHKVGVDVANNRDAVDIIRCLTPSGKIMMRYILNEDLTGRITILTRCEQ